MQPQGEEIQQKTNELVFKAYPSIELSTRDKVIKKIRQSGYNKENVLWVASEKIHGANFSVHVGENEVKYGRRTDFLTKSIPIQCENPGTYFLENFNSAGEYVGKIHNNLINVFKKLKEAYPNLVKFSLYGEYFGGDWPKANDSKCKAVQKGVYYTPYHQFMAFDIKVFTSESTFWVDVLDIPKFLQGQIKYVPIYQKGTFQELYEMNTKIDSTVPELLGLEKIEKNIIEGMVIRPNSNIYFPERDRVILKKKNAEFNQVVSKPKQKKKEAKVKNIPPEVLAYVEELDKYVNFNRVESVTSKYPDEKNRKKLCDQLVQDVVTDATKDQFKWPEQDAIYKAVKTELTSMCMKVLNEYFIKH